MLILISESAARVRKIANYLGNRGLIERKRFRDARSVIRAAPRPSSSLPPLADIPIQPVRRRERKQQRFKSPGSAQRFLSIHSATYNTFYHQRHLLKRSMYKEFRTTSFEVWQNASVAA